MSQHYAEILRPRRREEPVPTEAPKRPVLIARADWVAGQRVKRERELAEEAKRLEAEKQRRAERVSWFVDNFATLVSEGQDPWDSKASSKPVKAITRMSSSITATPALPDWSGRAYLLFDGNGDDDGAFDEETARDIAVALGDWSPFVTNHLDAWVVAIPRPHEAP